ncbi:MAG: sigma-54-dependent Fis family transcriptional regulator, partial [Myxococcales bacterium]|nr:sigma-54-dependent Fis family transcriptional regulator [Myxococcales bacterium]
SGRRAGLFAQAGEGTLFLDEVGELSSHIQPKLLRAIQEHTVRPVGSDQEHEVRCRVLSATNVDLKRAVADGTFRSDLYYRLAVIKLEVPPLRDRAGDILELAQHFIRRTADRLDRPEVEDMSTETARLLLSYPWPGNVRELENAMERAVAMTDGSTLLPTDLPEEMMGTEASPVSDTGLVSLAALEWAHIQRVLAATGGNKKAAAEILGLDRRTLYRKLEREQEP